MPTMDYWKKKYLLLGIESSFGDDTSAVVLCNDKVLSNIVARQSVHEEYGVSFPELASRAHQQNIVPVVDVALKKARYIEKSIKLYCIYTRTWLNGVVIGRW